MEEEANRAREDEANRMEKAFQDQISKLTDQRI